MKKSHKYRALPHRRTPAVQGFSTRSDTQTKVEYLDPSFEPRIRITKRAHGQMLALIKYCDMEIGWLSSCTRENNTFIIHEVFVPEQECTAVSTTITCDGEALLLSELLQQGRADVVNALSCWGHSHVDMQVGASGVDETQTDRFLRKAQSHFVRLIGNKRGDLASSVYLLDDGLAVYEPMLVVEQTRVRRYRDWAEEEIFTKVTQKPITASNPALAEVTFENLSHEVLDAWLASKHIDKTLYAELRSRMKTTMV